MGLDIAEVQKAESCKCGGGIAADGCAHAALRERVSIRLKTVW